ncbi:MAG: tetratricopeptide repeat protein [Bacteroidota bacterium]
MKNTICNIIAILFVASGFSQSAEEYYKTGMELYDNYDTKREAWESFTKAIEIDTNFKEAYYARGKFSDQSDSIRIANYSKAIELDIYFKEAYFERGGVKSSNLEDYKSAISDFSKAIEHGLNSKYVYFERAYANFQLKNYAEAIPDFTKAIEIDPEYNSAYYYRGYAKVLKGQKEKDNGCLDLNKAGELGLQNSYDIINEHCK